MPLRTIFLLLCTLPLTGSTVFADHLPESKLAPGKADRMLCQFQVDKTTVNQIITKLGEPNKVDSGDGEPNYFWNFAGLELEIGAWDTDRNKPIYFIGVSGKNPQDELGKTGRGLALGGTLKDVQRIYRKYGVVSHSENGDLEILIQFHNDETELRVEIGKKDNKIQKIQMTGEVE